MSRLKAAVDFRQGIGYLYDPETGKRFDQWLVGWRYLGDNEPIHLTFHFERSDFTTLREDHETT